MTAYQVVIAGTNSFTGTGRLSENLFEQLSSGSCHRKSSRSVNCCIVATSGLPRINSCDCSGIMQTFLLRLQLAHSAQYNPQKKRCSCFLCLLALQGIYHRIALSTLPPALSEFLHPMPAVQS